MTEKVKIGNHEITLPMIRYCLNCGELSNDDMDCCPKSDCRAEYIIPELQFADSREEPIANMFSTKEFLAIVNAGLNELAKLRQENEGLKKRVEAQSEFFAVSMRFAAILDDDYRQMEVRRAVQNQFVDMGREIRAASKPTPDEEGK